MTHVGRQSLDGNKTSPFDLRRRKLASSQRFAVFQNRAGAANADAATEFCAGQAKLVAQDPKQRRVVINIDVVGNAVNGEANFAHVGHVNRYPLVSI